MEPELCFVSTSGKETSRINFMRQLFVSLTIWSYYYICGLCVGTPTVAIPQLRKMANSTDAVSAEMASWIASIYGYSAGLFIFILVLVTHFFGRKTCLHLIAIDSLVASILLYSSYNAWHLFMAQFMYGMIVGAQMTILIMTMAEYTSADYRGVFLALKSATFFWGIWTANAIGIFSDYKYIGLLATLCSIFNCVATFYIPESPFWLASKGRQEDCAKTHRWLKGDKENAEKELSNLLKSTQKDLRKNNVKKTLFNQIAKYVINLKHPSIYKPIIISYFIFVAYHLSGKLVYTVYAIEMIKKITSDESTACISVLVLDGFSVLGMYIGSGLSKILNRRTMLLVTSAVATLFLFLMSSYLYLIKLSVISENAYATITILVGYSLAICCGPMIMSTTICGELLPIRCRSFCVCIYAFFCSMLLGMILKLSPYMFSAFGFHGAFLFFAIGSSVCIILIYFFVPETRGKTLHEIAAIFEEKKSDAAQSLLLTGKIIQP